MSLPDFLSSYLTEVTLADATFPTVGCHCEGGIFNCVAIATTITLKAMPKIVKFAAPRKHRLNS
nr:hypothetical protein [Chroococcidiopsis cubana]